MKNYLEQSGLDFSIGEDKLIYQKEDFAPAVGWIKDFQFAKYAYKDQTPESGPTYFGSRYFEKTDDLDFLVKHDYEYDVTVFQPGLIGDEFTKTVGHYHSHVPGTKISYTEAYEVVEGKVDYLLQSEPDENGQVDVIYVQAEEGDKVVMPPSYGHISLNPTLEIAIESNVQKRDLPKTSDYSLYKENVGGALYRTKDGLEKNPHYKIKSIRIVRPLEKADWGLTKDKPLYTSFIENPEKFDWLLHPQNYEFNFDELFEDIEL